MSKIATYLPWLLSVITIWMTVLAGNKHPSAWLVGLVNQALWLIWIVATSAWGLIPMNIALWIVYGRNHLKWQRSESSRIRGCSSSDKPVTLKDPQAARPVEAVRSDAPRSEGEK